MTRPTIADRITVADHILGVLDVAFTASLLGVTPRTVEKHRRRNGVLGPPLRYLSEEESAQVVELTQEGYSAEQIGWKLKVTARTVQRHRRAHHITKPYSRLSEDDKRRAQVLFDDGCSAAEVARTIGRTPTSVRRAFPGRAWTRPQIYEYNWVARRFHKLESA